MLNLKAILSSQDNLMKFFSKWRTTLASVEHLFAKTVIFSWYPHDKTICPSTLAKFIHENGGEIEEMEAQVTQKCFPSHFCPTLPYGMDLNDIEFDALEDWIGASLLNLSKYV